VLLVITACGKTQVALEDAEPGAATATNDTLGEAVQVAPRRFGGVSLQIPAGTINGSADRSAAREVFFGDLHVHTDYSFDAFAFGTIATPYDAYRYARGEPLAHPGGFQMQLRQPLDFYAVTDHAMFLGAVKAAADTDTDFSKLDYVQDINNLNAPENMNIDTILQRRKVFSTFLPETIQKVQDGSLDEDVLNAIAQDAWRDSVAAANAFYVPGKFTTFVAYEYTSSTDDRGNLHRNVVFQRADKLPAMPFSRFHSQDPEGLWDWMDGLRAQGIESLAIPHNSNGSNGHMFALTDWGGAALDSTYAEKRMRNEPLVEITQVKGTSETHPLLSPTDEWADFEIMPYRVATTLYSEPQGSYVRKALLDGLMQEQAGLGNAFKFGVVGASDSHTGAISDDESNFFSKVGLLDSTSALRGSTPLAAADVAVRQEAGATNLKEIGGSTYQSGAFETWGAAGITGVWAEENTRDAIYAAFRRKETFATSGPRIQVRFFAGYDLEIDSLNDSSSLSVAYNRAVSMGGELPVRGADSPEFLFWAAQDAKSAKLQRLQVIKGWLDNGIAREKVFDVACSDDGTVDLQSHRCPDNGARVDQHTCAISQGVGAGELSGRWRDPEYDPAQRAFYYVRVLENPTCRWSTWDAIKAGVPPREDLKVLIQERAWSSSIWLVPDGPKSR
jgi:hypothetical protein